MGNAALMTILLSRLRIVAALLAFCSVTELAVIFFLPFPFVVARFIAQSRLCAINRATTKHEDYKLFKFIKTYMGRVVINPSVDFWRNEGSGADGLHGILGQMLCR